MKGNKEIRLRRLGFLSEEVLRNVLRLGLTTSDVLISACIDSFMHRNDQGGRLELSSDQLKRAIKNLIQAGVISEKDEQIEITSQGRWEGARRRLLDSPKSHVPSEWDRKWRVIIFDIPEMDRRQRDMLRRSFIRYGFYLLQQSVWVYPYSCESFVRSIKEDLGFKAEVLYMLVEKIENQKLLEGEFSL